MRTTTLCYIQRGEQYLMLHRTKKENDANRDKWIGIGGGVESGETPQQGLLREVEEETGLRLTSYRYRAVIDFVSDRWEDEVMHLFTADGYEGEMIDCNEGDLEWIHRDALMALPHWEGDRIFLELLRQDADFFRLRLEYRGEELVKATLNDRVIREKGRSGCEIHS